MREGLTTLGPESGGLRFYSLDRLMEEQEERDHLADCLNEEEERLVEAGMELDRIAL